jgi:hypothetical protein
MLNDGFKILTDDINQFRLLGFLFLLASLIGWRGCALMLTCSLCFLPLPPTFNVPPPLVA